MKNVLILLLIILCSCNQSNKNNIYDNKSWVFYHVKDSIPQLLKKNISNTNDLKIANPNEQFNATDNLIDSLPDKQLVFIANNKDKWRLVYIQGGFGKYFVLHECVIKNDSIINLKKVESVQAIRNMGDFDKVIRRNTF